MRGGAALGEHHPLVPVRLRRQGELLRHEGDARGAGGGQHPTPVGIGAVDGGLDQGRARDRPPHFPGSPFGRTAGHLNLQQFGRALSVLDDGEGQRPRHLEHGFLERLGQLPVAERVQSRGAVGEKQHGVVGAGVAVHGDGVKAAVGDAVQQRRQGSGVAAGVGREHRQQRSEVGVDHPGPLGDPPDREGTSRCVYPDGVMLGAGVGGHDRLRRLDAARRGQAGGGVLEAGRHFFQRQRHPDDAGREHQRRPRG